MSLATRSKPFRYAQAKPIKTQQYKLPVSPVHESLCQRSRVPRAPYNIHSNMGYGSSKGSVILLPTDSNQYKPSGTPYTISAHATDLGDLTFNPFNSSQLATGAADGTVKLWTIPQEGLIANLSTPTTKFEGLDIVHSLAFHPTARGVLAAGSKNGLSVFDLGSESEKYSFKVDGFGKDLTSIHWNRTGSLIAGVAKNCALSVFDPRSGAADVLSTATPNALIKKLQHGLFIGGDGTPEFLLLFGVSSGQRPMMSWVDPRNPTVAVKSHDFQFSQGYSLPIYEPDTTTLYYTIRGSEMISLLDVEVEKNAPSVWQSHQFSSNSAVKGFTLLPKRAVATSQCEVNRIFALGADSVDAFSVTVPRKTAGFHEELFPDTTDNKPAQTADEWFAGGEKQPLKTSMVAIHESRGGAAAAPPSSTSPAPTVVSVTAAASRLSVSTPATESSSSSSTSATRGSVSALNPPNAVGRERGASAYVPSNTRASIDNMLKKSVYLHCTGKEPPSNFQSYFDLKLGPTLPLAENIQANSTFLVVPWKASGGSALAVFRLAADALGRCPPTQFCVRGHKSQASTFDLSQFDQCQLATGSVEGQIFLWRIPQGGLTKDLNEPESVLSSVGKVTSVKFHPYIKDLLVSAASSFDGNVLEFWNTSKVGNQDKPSLTLNLHPEPIIDFAFHPRSHLIATTSRDGKTRVIHLASQKVLKEWTPPESVKDTRVLFIGNDRVLTVGFGASGQRSMTLFDITASGSPTVLQTVELERVPYLPIPRYDADTRLLYLAHSGGTFIPLYQLNESSPYIEHLNTFQTSSDAVGFVLLPKKTVDVTKVELAKALKLTKDSILPITYTVPRKRLEFFQDDLYPPTRISDSEFSVDQFFSNAYPDGKDQTTESLKPANMTNLSEAPAEEVTEREAKYAAKLAADAAPKPVGALGHTSAEQVKEHFLGLQKHVTGNRFDARQDNSRIDVDESEWD